MQRPLTVGETRKRLARAAAGLRAAAQEDFILQLGDTEAASSQSPTRLRHGEGEGWRAASDSFPGSGRVVIGGVFRPA